MRKPSGKTLGVLAKNQLGYEFLRKFLSFPLENLNGKLIFDHFLGFQRLLANFSRFHFSRVRFGGIFRLVWIEAAWGSSSPMSEPSASPGNLKKCCRNVLSSSHTLTRGDGEGEPSSLPPPEFHTSKKNPPPKPQRGKSKRRKIRQQLPEP